ncbi:MAG: S8 family peptidase [Candidatus Zixiibacteriota bacterium]
MLARLARALLVICAPFVLRVSAVYGSELPANVFVTDATAQEALDGTRNVDAGSESTISALVFFESDPGIRSGQAPNTQARSLAERRRSTLARLESYSSSGEQTALKRISELPGAVIERRFWITRAALVRLPASELISLARIATVSKVIENISLEYVTPTYESPAAAGGLGGASFELTRLKAPLLWAQGITGAGRVVANFDTGVDGAHPALAGRYHGNTVGERAGFFSPASADTLPFDDIGHGTHTMGLMVGHNGVDTFGIAPDASWIAAAVVDQGNSLNGTIADLLAAFQWALNPDGDTSTTNDVPDVILNSWGIPIGLLGPCDNTFWEAIDNVEEAGIVTVFAAGNEGPAGFTIRSPANRVSAPLNSFSVGAIDKNTLQVADFSSRGPSTCDSVTFKPEVVAPGILVYSSDRNGGYAVRSGTSMSAPYVAGLVALLRDYNPNATVLQIKQAILAGAADLGPPGADNQYGHGLPDAARALALLPAPAMPRVAITEARAISGSFDPGQTVELQMSAQAPIGAYDSLRATLSIPPGSGVTVEPGQRVFYFSPGTGIGVNLIPFTLLLNDSLAHGTMVRLDLRFERPSGDFADAEYILTIGSTPPGGIATLNSGRMKLTVSDFGQFGLDLGSAYNVGGSGLRFENSENLLYEAGIVVGRNLAQLSSSIRDENNVSFFSDFTPLETISISENPSAETVTSAVYQDIFSPIPIPIEISQRVSAFNSAGADDYAFVEFSLRNTGIEALTGLRLGLFLDLDLTALGAGDLAGYDPGLNMIYQSGSGVAVGLVGLSAQYSGFVRMNQPGKSAFSRADKYASLLPDSIESNSGVPADWYSQMNAGPITLTPGDSQTVALALVLGSNLGELADAASRARSAYLIPTSVGQDQSLLPEGFALAQNYPNPFNPETTIEFSLPTAAPARLIVYNALGQAVRILYDSPAHAGLTRLRWDGRADSGAPVASGVYFYRLETDSFSLTRKMALIK